MDNNSKISPIPFVGLTREKLYISIRDSLVPQDSASEIFHKKDKDIVQTETRKSTGSTEVRYFEEKCCFLLMMFDPMLMSYVSSRKNTNFDYMTGLHLFMSVNPNFQYGYGLFKHTIPIFDMLIEHWNDFLEAIIKDIQSLPSINLKETIVLKLEDFLCFRISNNEIENATVDMNRFDSILRMKGFEYNFSLVLVTNGKPQPLISGKSNGKGKEGNLCKTIMWLNNLVGTKDDKKVK